MGINGGGKTTVLNLLEDALSYKMALYIRTPVIVKLTIENRNNIIDFPVYKVNTFDVKSETGQSNLDSELEHLIFRKAEDTSITFLDYRLNMLDKTGAEIELYKQGISQFFNKINDFFKATKKKIIFDNKINSVKFEFENGKQITLKELSSGEKQLLILLFTVFLQDKQKCVVLLDEPEISLHISWQDILIDTLVALNPNAQFFIVTHSPGVFGKGWGDKLTFIDECYTSKN